MQCRDIVQLLDKQSPPEYALEWDNVGLLVGHMDSEIKKILVAVDATADVVKKAVDDDYDMIVTHHPVIFGKIKNINDSTVLGQKLLALAENHIACYAMHTNFDTKGGMAKLAANILELKNQEVLEETFQGEGVGRIGFLDKPLNIEELAKKVKKKFGLKNVIVYGDKGLVVDKVAISPGSGKSVISEAVKKGVECLITGDIGHHEGIDSVDMGLSIIDASHYGIEKIFMEYICKYIKDFYPDAEVTSFDVGVPYEVI